MTSKKVLIACRCAPLTFLGHLMSLQSISFMVNHDLSYVQFNLLIYLFFVCVADPVFSKV